ncbi:MAG: hypothetical protein WDN49_12510 [Acetobacteraceae bacterium]
MKRDIGQGSLAEALVCRSSRRSEGRLDRIAALIDWDAVAAILSGLHPAQTGRPSYPPVVMMRALLLAQCIACRTPNWRKRWRIGCRFAVCWPVAAGQGAR